MRDIDGRIGRKLAVARSLGDLGCVDGGFVAPDVHSIDIGETEDALIIACDGLWDVMTDEAAAQVVSNAETAADAAVSLRNFAFALGSKENITVIVVKLHPREGDSGLCARNTKETRQMRLSPAEAPFT
jgi:serine/threonine protein phosphatase PrpC